MEAAYDTPLCPDESCRCPSVPIREAAGRFYGPADANLFCVGCGSGWVGTDEQVAQAEKSQAAYEAECVADAREVEP